MMLSSPDSSAPSTASNTPDGRVRFAAGTVLFRAGDPCRGLLAVEQGSIRVQTVTESGRQVTLYRVGSDRACVLSTQCLMTGGVYPAEGVAETDVVGRFLSAAEVERRIREDAPFRGWLFQGYGVRLTELVLLVEDLLSSGISRRLARLLREKSATDRVVRLTHQDIAGEIGSAREVVSRHLKDLERRGAVALGRGSVSVLRPDVLEALEMLPD
ncbi:Crp/Fnr family transcriptional regulator [Alsobacter sp. SYSU M60028]|uniref:Crp/Fnr family transcriptional regulator n=1 Tax=Alsobacter ponti TaxID=2962936 RepID=A0ABT1LBJ5_9HYPH|nr:Crp/Fnr family transcriptional regulator [Alsobacter ponti]MCP8937623.1 Crp/Fnr family transcriptional regulator [Alsobacter ponti]